MARQRNNQRQQGSNSGEIFIGCVVGFGIMVLLAYTEDRWGGIGVIALLVLVFLCGWLLFKVQKWPDRSQAMAPLMGARPTSCVYMLKAGQYYKIGKATQFDRRIRQIKLQLPFPVEVVHTIATDRITEVEAYWHRRFKKKRTNGEWFVLTEAEVAEFKQHSVM